MPTIKILRVNSKTVEILEASNSCISIQQPGSDGFCEKPPAYRDVEVTHMIEFEIAEEGNICVFLEKGDKLEVLNSGGFVVTSIDTKDFNSI